MWLAQEAQALMQQVQLRCKRTKGASGGAPVDKVMYGQALRRGEPSSRFGGSIRAVKPRGDVLIAGVPRRIRVVLVTKAFKTASDRYEPRAARRVDSKRAVVVNHGSTGCPARPLASPNESRHV